MTENNNKSPHIESFLQEFEELCRKHNLSISHEDGHRLFIIEGDDEDKKYVFKTHINKAFSHG